MDVTSRDMNGGQKHMDNSMFNTNADLPPPPFVNSVSQSEGSTEKAVVAQDKAPLPVFGPSLPPISYQQSIQSYDCAEGAVGLVNLGNTCYMNAGLQCLFANSSLMQEVIDVICRQSALSVASCDSQTAGVYRAFYELVAAVWGQRRSPVKPSHFKQALGERFAQFNNFTQHDCQEFLTVLLESLNEAFKTRENTPGDLREQNSPNSTSEQVQQLNLHDQPSPLPQLCTKNQPCVNAVLQYYEKENKTLNTNLLNIDDSMEVATASGKFLDNSSTSNSTDERSQRQFVADDDLGMEAVKRDCMKEQFLRTGSAELVELSSDQIALKAQLNTTMALKQPGGTSKLNVEPSVVNNAKRMKMEPEKNLRQEAKKRMNIDYNPTRSAGRTASESSQSSHPDLSTEEEVESDRLWYKFNEENHSIITNTFYGQLRSAITCAQCGHESVTFESFNCLSVPLPGATERQLVVTFMRNTDAHMAPIQYLITCPRSARVRALRLALLQLLRTNEQRTHVLLAVVRAHRFVRILDDEGLLTYVSTSGHSAIYAMEMNVPPEPPVQSSPRTDETQISDINTTPHVDLYSQQLSTTSSPIQPTSDNIQISQPDNPASGLMISVVEQTNSPPNSQQLHTPESTPERYSSVATNIDISKSRGNGDTVSDALLPKTSDAIDISAVSNSLAQTLQPDVETGHFKCCICLEHFEASEVVVHLPCSGRVCTTCLSTMRGQAAGDSDTIACPMCRAVVSVSRDLVCLARLSSAPAAPLMLTVGVLFRHDISAFTSTLFAHPRLLYIPSKIETTVLRQLLASVALPLGVFITRLVSESGLICSRCTDHDSCCTGCELDLSTDDVISLTSQDTLAICYSGLNRGQRALLEATSSHVSMRKLSNSCSLQLNQCLRAFSQRERLEEEMYCDRCRSLHAAYKQLSVCRLPKTLIILLKRFEHDATHSSSFKLDIPVKFPVESLDLTEFLTRSSSVHTLPSYDLQSLVCHTGSLCSGHYTCYARHPNLKTWNYYNDETVSEKIPTSAESDFSSAYILFYSQTSNETRVSVPAAVQKFAAEHSTHEQQAIERKVLNRLSLASHPAASSQCAHLDLAVEQPTRVLKNLSASVYREL